MFMVLVCVSDMYVTVCRSNQDYLAVASLHGGWIAKVWVDVLVSVATTRALNALSGSQNTGGTLGAVQSRGQRLSCVRWYEARHTLWCGIWYHAR